MSVLPVGFGSAAGGTPAGAVERSLRFNSADSAYLNRTFGTPTNPDKLTISFWVKRGAIASSQYIWGSNNAGTNDADLYFNASDQLVISSSAGSVNLNLITTQVFRDPSAWYHIVVAIDTAQATSSDRAKLYVNGVQVTAFGTATYPAQNTDITFNRAYPQFLGCRTNSLGNFFNGYLTEIYMIDGQALTPSSFGETDSATGVWKPKAYSGTYGTNGFYLKFADNSGTTSTTLGKDSSGNGNNWTPNNFSVTAGAGNDSLVDSPTSYGTGSAGGDVRGNYCTMNPLQYSSTYVTLNNGNLNVTGSSGVDAGGAFGTAKVNSGKWYWEATVVAVSGTYPFIGFAVNTTGTQYQGGARVNTSGTLAIASPESFITLNGSPSGTSFTTNDVLQFALDMDNGKMWIGKNGTWMNSGVPASGTGNVFSISDRTQFVSPYIFSYNSSQVAYNFGQRAFAYTAPSGFKALCTQNLPTPTIGATSTTQANDYFNPVLYTGNGTSSNAITGVGFQPDFVWIKPRSLADHHRLTDAVRGVRKTLKTNLTDAESSNTANDLLYTFDSDGFTIGGSDSGWNGSGSTYVSWNWKANGAGGSNTAGTITSTVSANTTSGFSIVTYTGTGATATVGHGLGVAPSMIITKQRNGTWAWMTYHANISVNAYLLLNATDAQATSRPDVYNGAPSSTVINIGNNATINGSGNTYVAYCFAPVAGYSAFGSYTGNGSTDGPFVYLGFRPRFLLLKISSTTGNWAIYDTSRNTYNVMDLYLYPNSSAAEGGSGTPRVDALSNGFKLRNSGQDNTSSATYIYAAFAETPTKFSLAR